jgi:transposase
VAGVSGVPQGEGPRLFARAVDDPASRPACSREWTGARTYMSGQSGSEHGVQDPRQEVEPRKVRYYLEQRDPDFAEKMAEVLRVFRQVKILRQAATSKTKRPSKPVAIISYDERPGIQAIATTAPNLPAEPGLHATFAREHENKRQGTVSLLAGIDLVGGKVHALLKDRNRSREFIELLHAAYPARTAIKLILDNHSAHISRETKAWLADQLVCRFESTFTPNHGPWLNLVEGFFSKLTRSVLRHIPSLPSESSRIASSPPWIISTAIPSLTPGPHDMIRTSKSLG